MDNEILTKVGNKAEWASGGGGGGSAATTLHINISAVNFETLEATFTADKTPTEMLQAAVNGPVWCVVTIAAGIMGDEVISVGVPPAWRGGGQMAFGGVCLPKHGDNGNNHSIFAVYQGAPNTWIVDVMAFAS